MLSGDVVLAEDDLTVSAVFGGVSSILVLLLVLHGPIATNILNVYSAALAALSMGVRLSRTALALIAALTVHRRRHPADQAGTRRRISLVGSVSSGTPPRVTTPAAYWRLSAASTPSTWSRAIDACSDPPSVIAAICLNSGSSGAIPADSILAAPK